MLLVSVLFAILWRATVCQADLFDSADMNSIEMSPLYNTIIFNDISDLMNDMEVKLGGPSFDTTYKNESPEDVDNDLLDLLSEYQDYLDKAHKQIKSFYEKSKNKNKVPQLRKDKFSKTKPGQIYDRQTLYSGNPNPVDFFVPINPNLNFLRNSEIATLQPKITPDFFSVQKLMEDIYKPPNMPYYSDEGFKSCSCKNSEDCKKCLTPLGRISLNNNGVLENTFPKVGLESIFPKIGFENTFPDGNIFLGADEFSPDKKLDDSLNVRVKVDIEVPKLFDIFTKLMRNFTHEKVPEHNSVNSFKHGLYNVLPTSHYNYPIAMHMYGNKNAKISQFDVTPIRSLTLHKKKKQRPSISKKHRKKLITLHNYKIEPQRSLKSIIVQSFSVTNATKLENKTNTPENITSNVINATQEYDITPNSTQIDKCTNSTNMETQTVESVFMTVNVSNIDITNEGKLVNSIETDNGVNLTTTKPISYRRKRDTMPSNGTTTEPHNLTLTIDKNTSLPQLNDTKEAKTNPKKEKDTSLSESELLYWPAALVNETSFPKTNITTLILERENKKSKLNITKDFLKNNRTEALQRAIFGDVDFNDVDAVAPVFLSFVGKYVEGILTFCSQKTCHSMKCEKQSCIHRVCTPDQRINRKGHCMGSNSTDSVVSMESIMDLPSNIAFDIVDILENKMLGRLFGKATLCIGNKCITFVVSKKNFMKTKCTTKELNSNGHCFTAKNVKFM